MKKDNENLTEYDAAYAFAQAWNKLDPAEFLNILSNDAVYTSQWVLTAQEGKAIISDYLIGKMQAVKESKSTVVADVGKATQWFPNRDCALLYQGDMSKPDAVVLFDVLGDHVKAVSLCMPDLLNPLPNNLLPK